MSETGTRGGFVFRAVSAVRGLFDDPPTGQPADYVPVLVRHLFDGVLGYGDISYSQRDDWGTVTFVDRAGRPALVLAATAAGGDLRAARSRAIVAMSGNPTAHYAVATNRDELAVFSRCSPSHPTATERAGVVTRKLTEIDLRSAVERSTDRSLAEALTPDQQLSIAKLTALQRDTISEALDSPGPVDTPEPTVGDLAAASRPATETTPETVAQALTESLEDVLLPAVSSAFDRLSRRIQEFADRESELDAHIEEAKAAGDEAAVTSLRADLFDLREEYVAARRLEAGFARWRQVDDSAESDTTAAAAFKAESAAVALDTLLLARVAADRGLADEFGTESDFWTDQTKHSERDANEMMETIREELAGVSENATDDGTFAWVFQTDITDAFSEAVATLTAATPEELDARELTAAFDSHLSDDGRTVRGATRPATAGLLLDRAGYTAEAAIDDSEADLLDPACGDGSLLVGAADRLLARLDRTDVPPGEALETVRDRIHGVDRHPYAVHLAETRLLLRTVDVHADAAQVDTEFSLGRFGVYRSDALRTERGTSSMRPTSGTRDRRREQAAEVKTRESFGFVVSDTPTGVLTDPPKSYKNYANAEGEYDYSTLFLERAADWLADGGRLSMAVDGSLLDSESGAGARSRLTAAFRLRELIEFDTGSDPAPVFVAAERHTDTTAGWETYPFTYARVTPTFLDLVCEGLIRPGTGEEPTPAELVSRCLPTTVGGDPPSMTAVLVELDLVCDATVDGPMPVEVRAVESSDLTDGDWSFTEKTAEATRDATVPSLNDSTTDDPQIGSARSQTGSPEE